MNPYKRKQLAIFALLALPLINPAQARAQGLSNLIPNGAAQAPSALSGSQQSLANKALCSALASQVPNPASASPSALSSPSVMTAAASSFAGSTKLPLPSATTLLQGYVTQHATDILASCAVSNATGGSASQLPGGGSIPSIPKF